MSIRHSIIIPTYNKISLLKPCIESIIQNTDLTNTEVIVVSNGCKDGSVEYIKNLGDPFKIIQWSEPLGYPCAVNIGICASKGDIVVLLNNDIKLLNTDWLQLLVDPFIKIPNAGVTGVVKGFWNKKPWVIFFCAAIKREVFNKVGLLDLTFFPGTGEDVDFCIKASNAGYTIHQVPEEILKSAPDNHNLKFGSFPIWHLGSATFNNLTEEFVGRITTNSSEILTRRYGIQYPNS